MSVAPPLSSSSKTVSTAKLTFMLASAVAIGPFAIDTYLPAFPSIAEGIGIDIHEVSLTISVYIFFMAIGQLLGGPVSDRYGRRLAMMVGLIIFIVSSLMLAMSHSLASLLFWRALQAFGGGWTSVSIPAIVRDRCKGKEAAKLFSMIGLIMIIAPAIAPTVGSTILAFSGWRSIFIFLALYGAIVAVSLWFGLFSKVPPSRPKHQERLLRSYWNVILQPMAVRFIVIQAMAFSVMLTFLTHASFIYQEWFGLSAYAFSLLFAGNIVIMAVMNIAGRKLLAVFEPVQVVKFGVSAQVLAVSMLVVSALWLPSLYLFAPALMLAVGSLGAVAPNIQASYMHFFEHNSGTASALLGAIPMILTGLISGLSTLLSDGTLNPIVLLMLVCTITGLVLVWRAPVFYRKELAKES
ncbi:MFS transporter permease [Hahella sp. CCB-MM4]|uniref:multidrug effflux MFS transporter n=1 Tax=Hahella sp. (strain CCB-MM4) TaxID=1926491 RepID=UPI000B9A99DF|nr:multidrug effflux MFS transporter [Hahella sp. CCB-MM4]OZG70753.1 MFS transporter permease [Hahella sp. CCB-MM4]